MKKLIAKSGSARVFKTSWFTKAARKAHLKDGDLYDAAVEAMSGQCDDLGGGVLKKRLNKNLHRSILLAKGKQNWIFQFLFAKKDMANISDDELLEYRKLAKIYEKLTEKQLKKLIETKALVEIFDEDA